MDAPNLNRTSYTVHQRTRAYGFRFRFIFFFFLEIKVPFQLNASDTHLEHVLNTMLPPELLLRVCEYLTPKDILSLSETSSTHKTVLANLRTSFLEHPWFDQNFSQWKMVLWGSAKYPKSKTPFKNVPLPLDGFDVPLPSDFQALVGDCRRDENYGWNICDQGLYFNTVDDSENEDWDQWELDDNGILDLREDQTSELPATPYPLRSMPILDVPDKVIAKERNDKVSAAIVEDCFEYQFLAVKYRENEMQVFDIDYDDHIYYSLYLVGAMVIVYSNDMTTPQLYLLPGKPELANLEDTPTRKYEGLMMYNGNLFKAVLDFDGQLVVGPLNLEVNEKIGGERMYKIHQDERNPRYALVCTRKEGVVAYVVDLEDHTISLLLDKENLWLVGLSKGKLGMWKYTTEYVYRIGTEQGKDNLGELAEFYYVTGIDIFLSHYGHLFDLQ